MADYQQVVEDMQGLLYSLSPVDKSEMARLNEQYRTACNAANTRLRRCLQLLQQGLRSEALQQCEEAPNLLDLAARLDFPELPQWNELLVEQQLPGAPSLLIDAAGELNDAYVAEQPLASLLRTHRLLALGRASLAARLQTLRFIAQRDAANPVWRQDLQEYEQARCSELEKDVTQAGRDGDLAKVRQVRDELRNGVWATPPPVTLVERVEATYAELDRGRARLELASLEQALNDAFAAMDVTAGKQHKARWDECLSIAAPEPEDEILQRAAPALQWLSEQETETQQYERYEAALRDLDRALTKEKTVTKVHLAYQNAARFGFVLPETLVLAYESRLAELERERKRRTWLVVLCFLAAACVLAALTLWEFKRRERHMHAKDVAVRLSGMIPKEQWDDAQRVLDQVSPELLEFSELSDVAKQVRDGFRGEQRRRQDFAHRLQQAETLMDQLRVAGSAGAADSVLADLTKLIDETTAQLARSESEKQRLRELAQAADNELKTMKGGWNQAFAEQSQRVTALLASLNQELGATSEQLSLLAPTAINQATSLRKRLEEAGQEVSTLLQLRATVDPDRGQVALNEEQSGKNLIETLEQRCVAYPVEQRITAALPDPDKFHLELSKYREQFPATRRVSQDVLAEHHLWAGLGAWSDLARRWAETPRAELTPQAAAAWLEDRRRLGEQYPDFPQHRDLEPLTPHLEAIRSRNDDKGRWLPAALKQNLETNIFFDNWTVLANTKVGSPAGSEKSEKKYYLLRAVTKPANPTTEVRVEYLCGVDGRTKTVTLLGEDVVAVEPSRHSLLLKQLTHALGGVKDDDWAQAFRTMFDLVRRFEGVDPIYQINILQELMEVGCRGSYPLATACAADLAFLRQAGRTELWMDPYDTDAAAARNVVASQLRAPGLFDSNVAATRTREFYDVQARVYAPVGWLSLSPAGQWQCLSRQPPAGSGRLYVVRRASGQDVELMSVGEYEAGRIRLPPGTTGGPQAGRPVYAEVPLRPAGTEELPFAGREQKP